jgi:hypothetical protein
MCRGNPNNGFRASDINNGKNVNSPRMENEPDSQKQRRPAVICIPSRTPPTRGSTVGSRLSADERRRSARRGEPQPTGSHDQQGVASVDQ